MAYEIPGFSFTLVAGADLTAKQFHFVDVNSSGAAIVPTGAGARTVGVLQNKPDSGEAATIVNSGIVMVVAGDDVTRGANVQTDVAGKVIDAGSGDVLVGVALEAGASGEVIAVLLGSNAASLTA